MNRILPAFGFDCDTEVHLSDAVPELTVDIVEDDEPVLFGPRGEPLCRPRLPFGFVGAED